MAKIREFSCVSFIRDCVGIERASGGAHVRPSACGTRVVLGPDRSEVVAEDFFAVGGAGVPPSRRAHTKTEEADAAISHATVHAARMVRLRAGHVALVLLGPNLELRGRAVLPAKSDQTARTRG